MSGPRARAFGPVLVCVALVVSLISSLGAPLIPSIARDLHSSLSAAQWSLTATLLVGAVTSPLVGRLGDGPHRKLVMLVCLGAVTVGGLLAAIGHDVSVLIAGRALQGLGLATMPLAMASAREVLGPQRSPRVIATLSVAGPMGIGLGYPITGLLAEHTGASGAFWFGVIVSGIAFTATALVVPRARPQETHGTLDMPGALLVGAGLLAILIPLEKAGAWGWGAPRTLVLLAAGVALLVVWVRHELAVEHPLVDLRLLRHRTVLSTNVAAFTLGVGMYLSIVLISQYVQGPSAADGGFGFGTTVFVSGLVLVPFSFTSYAASSAMPFVARRLGVRAIVPIGCVVMAAACLFFGLTADHLWQAFVMLGVVGLGLGFTFAAMPQIIVSSVPAGETSSSLSFYQVTRYVGFSAGSSLSVTLLSAFSGGGDLTRGAFRGSFLVAAAIVLATAVVAWVATGAAAGSRRASHELEELAVEDGRLEAAGLPDIDTPRTAPARAAH